MLRMAGIKLHPAMRLAIGAGLIAIGLARHNATPLIGIGAAFVVFGVASLVGMVAQRR
jgi:hypothetical protein